MIGLVLISHGKLAEELVSIAEHIMGAQTQIAHVSVNHSDNIDKCRQQVLLATEEVDSGNGVILLTDMFGGTPSNVAVSTLSSRKLIELVAGVNLPMLIKLIAIRESLPLKETAEEARKAGREYINLASELLENI